MAIKKDEHWFQSFYRPALGWVYVLICGYDFIVGPALFNILEFMNPDQQITAYTAVTLQGSGLFHISMGTILGLTTHGRSKEKIASLESSKL